MLQPFRQIYFYPRPPRGGRLFHPNKSSGFVSISIHALREEGDRTVIAARTSRTDFYPRPPRGGRHKFAMLGDQSGIISIHALREEGDYTDAPGHSPVVDFYPRPPRGGRRLPQPPCCCTMVFLSTPSVRRATLVGIDQSGHIEISIHALREEGDRSAQG